MYNPTGVSGGGKIHGSSIKSANAIFRRRIHFQEYFRRRATGALRNSVESAACGVAEGVCVAAVTSGDATVNSAHAGTAEPEIAAPGRPAQQ